MPRSRREMPPPDFFHPSDSYDPAKLARVRPAPEFRPTEAEFADPLVYIDSICAQIQPFGIAKIIPPPSWRPPDMVPASVSFPTRVQALHGLRHRRNAPARFEEYVRSRLFDTARFVPEHVSRNMFFPPVMEVARSGALAPHRAPVDLWTLYQIVQRRGGIENVWEKDWLCVLRDMRLPRSWSTALQMMNIYNHYLRVLPIGEPPPVGFAFDHPKGVRISEPASTTPAVPSNAASVAAPVPTLKRERNCRESLPPRLSCCACNEHVHESIPKSNLCNRCGDSLPTFCLKCRTSSTVPLQCQACQFGYSEGAEFTITSFKDQAERFRDSWFPKQAARGKTPRMEQVEATYWRIVELASTGVRVNYGADLSDVRAGFPDPRQAESYPPHIQASEVMASPWNLNVFPTLASSLVNHLPRSMSGVSKPWLYVGMMFSTFAFHFEDMALGSINYAFGPSSAGKVWYGAPSGDGAATFENAVRACVPHLVGAHPDLLTQMITMISPIELMAHGAQVCRTVQYAGEFVITLPQAYHGGFSLGFNVGEAVNFVTADYIPVMKAASKRCHRFQRRPVLSIARLVLSAARFNGIHKKLSRAHLRMLVDSVIELVEEELCKRLAVVERHPHLNISTALFEEQSDSARVGREARACKSCRQPCYFSRVVQRLYTNEPSGLPRSQSTCFCLDCALESRPFAEGDRAVAGLNAVVNRNGMLRRFLSYQISGHFLRTTLVLLVSKEHLEHSVMTAGKLARMKKVRRVPQESTSQARIPSAKLKSQQSTNREKPFMNNSCETEIIDLCDL